MIEHDPHALLGGGDPQPGPWESLARHARWLADMAEHCATLDPVDLAPAEGHDPLAELDQRAIAVRTLVAACRRATFAALREGGMSQGEIAELWDIPQQSVSRTLRRGPGRIIDMEAS